MNFNGIYGSGPIVGPQTSESRARRPSSMPPAPPSPAAKTHISGPGQLFSQLSQLSQSDPEKFKEIAQKISDELKSTAENSTGRESAIAQKLAERFGEAAQSGDLSAFRTDGSQHQHHHHHHHHHGHSGGGDEVRSVLQNALDMVHEALTAPSSTGAAGATDASGAPVAGSSTDDSSSSSSASDATPAAALGDEG